MDELERLQKELDRIKRTRVRAASAGGKARAEKLTPAERSQISRKGGLMKGVNAKLLVGKKGNANDQAKAAGKGVFSGGDAPNS